MQLPDKTIVRTARKMKAEKQAVAKANKLKKGMVCSVSYYNKGGMMYSAGGKWYWS